MLSKYLLITRRIHFFCLNNNLYRWYNAAIGTYTILHTNTRRPRLVRSLRLGESWGRNLTCFGHRDLKKKERKEIKVIRKRGKNAKVTYFEQQGPPWGNRGSCSTIRRSILPQPHTDRPSHPLICSQTVDNRTGWEAGPTLQQQPSQLGPEPRPRHFVCILKTWSRWCAKVYHNIYWRFSVGPLALCWALLLFQGDSSEATRTGQDKTGQDRIGGAAGGFCHLTLPPSPTSTTLLSIPSVYWVCVSALSLLLGPEARSSLSSLAFSFSDRSHLKLRPPPSVWLPAAPRWVHISADVTALVNENVQWSRSQTIHVRTRKRVECIRHGS